MVVVGESTADCSRASGDWAHGTPAVTSEATAQVRAALGYARMLPGAAVMYTWLETASSDLP
ncbi:MAG: hypothetical protein JWP32_2251 [Schumannella sp.]|nr:hypothetical protein [Schumannella sp.]